MGNKSKLKTSCVNLSVSAVHCAGKVEVCSLRTLKAKHSCFSFYLFNQLLDFREKRDFDNSVMVRHTLSQ